MRAELTQTIEDYLKTIYELTTTEERASTNGIAERLNVTAASVTSMIQKLAATDPPLVDYQKHRGVALTPDGRQVALEILRHHRLLELFLHQILGFEWDEVHAEADRLEHVISEEFEERIAQALGNPEYDPHGHPIPTRDLHMPTSPTTRLYDLRPGQKGTVLQVQDSDPELLRYLGKVGLTPQAQIDITDFSPFDENLTLQVAGREETLVLGPRISRQITVQIQP